MHMILFFLRIFLWTIFSNNSNWNRLIEFTNRLNEMQKFAETAPLTFASIIHNICLCTGMRWSVCVWTCSLHPPQHFTEWTITALIYVFDAFTHFAWKLKSNEKDSFDLLVYVERLVCYKSIHVWWFYGH